MLNRFLFDGPLGVVAARIMARRNAEAEREAVEILAPGPADAVLAIGFGAGVGVAELLAGVPDGEVSGVDPSWAMVAAARRRNRSGRVRLVRGRADHIPWPDNTFDGATAVNSLQCWRPLPASVAEVARVLRPGGRLVTCSHDWVIARGEDETLAGWLADITAALVAGGFVEVRHWRARAEAGRSIALTARAR